MLDFIEKPGFVIVLLVALVVFGSKRLPDSARSLGRSMRILKAEAKGLKDDEPSGTPVAPPSVIAAPVPVAPQSLFPPTAVPPPVPPAPAAPIGTPVADQAEHRA